ncbi:MAG: type II toxin-antitoxin system VapC family toxin [Roseiarcus sp.]
MFIDASAMVAMLTDEPDGDRLARVLEGDQGPITSAIAIYETAARLMSKSSLSGEEARRTVEEFLRTTNVRVVAIGEREAEMALRAFERFGKRRHSAGLNMGDCFAYACAKVHGAPLLFIGDDFSLTDVNAPND